MMESYSESADKNRQPILEKLRIIFDRAESVLEIGSGSGQHAIFFSQQLPHLTWQVSEIAEKLPALQSNVRQHCSSILAQPVLLNVESDCWPLSHAESIFTANTLHIMPWPVVVKMFIGIGRILDAGGQLCIYGAMRYNDAFTSASNERFDLWLKEQDPVRGIRDFEAVDRLARAQGLKLLDDHAMPSNNQLLVWQRK